MPTDKNIGWQEQVRPTHLVPADGRRARLNRAHEAFVERGIIQKCSDGITKIKPYELPLYIDGKGATANFMIHPFIFNQGMPDEDFYFVAVRGDLQQMKQNPPLVRLQSFCPHGHGLGSAHCDCGVQSELARNMIANNDTGGIFIIGMGKNHAGRGIGTTLIAALYALGYHTGLDVVKAAFNAVGLEKDERDFEPMAKILHHIGLEKIRLITNNPDKISQMSEFGITVENTVPMEMEVSKSALKERLLLAQQGHTYDHAALQKQREQSKLEKGADPLSLW